MNKYSVISIKYALLSFVLTIAITILSIKADDFNSEIIFTMVGLLAIVIIILSIIGIIKSVKSFKEPRKFQVAFGFITNLAFLSLYLYLIITNY